MTAAVLDMRGVPVEGCQGLTPQQQAVVSSLERLLEQARNGELSAVAVTYVREDRKSCSYVSEIDPRVQRLALVGAVALLQHRLCHDFYSEASDV